MKTLIAVLVLATSSVSSVASADLYPSKILSCKNSASVTFEIPAASSTGVFKGELDLNQAGRVQFNCTKAFAGPGGKKSILWNCTEAGNRTQPMTFDVFARTVRASAPQQFTGLVFKGQKQVAAPLSCLSYLM